MTWQVLEGDATDRLADLEAGSVQTCITSPPYWGLRDYGDDGQLGLEPTPEAYVANLVAVFRGVRRVLRDDGTLWLNLGDSYAGGGGFAPDAPTNQRRRADGSGIDGNFRFSARVQDRQPAGKPKGIDAQCKPKDLVGIPWMVAFALRADGWYLRSDIIWAKPNPMPEPVTDRPTKAHEYLFLLTKSPRYFYDADAIRNEAVSAEQTAHNERYAYEYEAHTVRAQRGEGIQPGNNGNQGIHSRPGPGGSNKRSVWIVSTTPYSDAHFATFPPKLIEPCVLAGSATGDLVLDPFAGAGTTGLVALRHDRDFVGVELNPEYAAMARNRIRDDAPLFNVAAEA